MSDSDIEMQTAIPKKKLKKAPKSPTAELLKKQEAKKISTKEMVHQALSDLKSRKGTSLYAIKKYIEEKYKVDVEKINYIIKKHLKTSVETGTIIQTKGVGASGSFKLAPKDKLKKETNEKKPDKSEKTSKEEISDNRATKKKTKKVEITKTEKLDKKEQTTKIKSKEKVVKTKTGKMAKGMQTPAKKRAAMMKRKSIGSIIKPPKMKPKPA